MSEELQQQSQSDAMQGKTVKITQSFEHLKTSSDKLAKFGFDLIESSIDGAQSPEPRP